MKLIIRILIISLCIQGCNLFDKNERLLIKYKKTNGEKVEIYYVSLGVTTNDVIQVWKSNSERPLWASDKYNYLKSSLLTNDTTLQLVLSDTGYDNHDNKLDTIFVNTR